MSSRDLELVFSADSQELTTQAQDAAPLHITVEQPRLVISTEEPEAVLSLHVDEQPLVIHVPPPELSLTFSVEPLDLSIGQLVPVGGGEENTGANVGGGSEVFRDKTGVTLNFRTLVGAGDIQVTQAADTITISSAVAGDVFAANCLATDQPGDAVYITGPVVGGLRQVSKIDPLADPVQAFVGILLSKSSPTECQVQRNGQYAVPYSVGLSGILFVALDGRMTPTPPTAPAGQILALQSVATGVDTDVVLLQPGWQIHKLRG